MCPVNLQHKVGSFDCTANCKNNKNTRKEIELYAFDLPKVRCEAITKMVSNNQQKLL